MYLLVGIDTEGDNQWDASARRDQRFENLYALPRLHALFARHGVRPTYVITHPVARDPQSAATLRTLLAADVTSYADGGGKRPAAMAPMVRRARATASWTDAAGADMR